MATLAQDVIAILNDASLAKLMNYKIEGRRISYSDLQDVAKAIKKGQVTVVRSGKSSGAYNPEENILRVPDDITQPRGKAVVVHEAVHCVHDIRGMMLIALDDEVVAFTAHGLYLREFDSRFNGSGEYTSDGSETSNLIAALLPVADLVRAGWPVDPLLLQELRSAISAHPDYNTTPTTFVHHNGLKKI